VLKKVLRTRIHDYSGARTWRKLTSLFTVHYGGGNKTELAGRGPEETASSNGQLLFAVINQAGGGGGTEKLRLAPLVRWESV